MKNICKRCNTIREGKCPIFKQSAADDPEFGGKTYNEIYATVYSTVDTVGCRFTDVKFDE